MKARMPLRKRAGLILSAFVGVLEAAADWTVTRCGRCYIAAAAVLISCVTFVFFFAIIPEVLGRKGTAHAAAHSAAGLVLLGNVVFSYAFTVRTPPGCSADLPPHILAAEAEQARHCARCDLPKPSGAHHCHICDKCILQMDHHCPWMDTCVGWANYRYFLLTLFWLTVGATYAAAMTWSRIGSAIFAASKGGAFLDEALLLMFVAVLATAMAVAIGVLLSFNLYLISTCQTTIDFHGSLAGRPAPHRGSGPRTARQNFQEVFDVKGRLWWLSWLVPNPTAKQGIGILRH
mmetsp:Transcript_11612/g.34882  ORF Transcript_11612/g.34882 Transcript_11612/m.34882 type:complete len:290 (-) Transcript_11612:466-1335(-)